VDAAIIGLVVERAVQLRVSRYLSARVPPGSGGPSIIFSPFQANANVGIIVDNWGTLDPEDTDPTQAMIDNAAPEAAQTNGPNGVTFSNRGIPLSQTSSGQAVPNGIGVAEQINYQTTSDGEPFANDAGWLHVR
jgi:hypothetical protein